MADAVEFDKSGPVTELLRFFDEGLRLGNRDSIVVYAMN
jgi:hypothetical protein